jgi:hypothetical protein
MMFKGDLIYLMSTFNTKLISWDVLYENGDRLRIWLGIPPSEPTLKLLKDFIFVYNFAYVNVYAIIIVLCISIDKSNIRTRSLRNTHSQETQHLSWETL